MNPTETFCLSARRRENCRNSESSAPLPKGFVTDAWNASVGYSRDSACSHRFVTHAGTKSTLFRSRMTCLCRFMASFLRWCSRCRHRVPSGSRASSTCTMTSEESTTLYSSPQMRLLWPFSKSDPRAASSAPSVFTTRSRSAKTPASMPSAYASPDAAARAASADRSSVASFGRFCLRPALNVSLNGAFPSKLTRRVRPFSGSANKLKGSFFCLMSTVYPSLLLFAMSSRNSSSAFWPMTRVFPNQRRSGTMRVLGSSLLCKSCFSTLPFLSRVGFCLYIIRRRTVAAERTLCEPLPRPTVDMEWPLGFLLTVPLAPAPPPGDFAPLASYPSHVSAC